MTRTELYDMIDSLADDIEFDYNGVHGSICPFSRTNIVISYGNTEKNHENIESALIDKIYDGKCLIEIAEKIEVY